MAALAMALAVIGVGRVDLPTLNCGIKREG